MTTNEEAVLSDRISISRLGEMVNRVPATIRWWERKGIIPDDLLPKRDARGARYWSRAQALEIVAWMHRLDLRPGNNFPAYKPTEQEVADRLQANRAPRPRA